MFNGTKTASTNKRDRRVFPRLTSQRRLEVDFGLAVEVLHAGRPAARQEDVLLLVPRRRVVDRPFALLVEVGHGCEGHRRERAQSVSPR